MAGWIREDLASGKLSPDAGAKAFDDLGTSQEQRSPDLRSPDQVQLDQQFPVAKPHEYVLNFFTPGQAPPVIPQEVKQFDEFARTWLSQAGFPLAHGNSLATAIGRVIDKTQGMTEEQLQSYGETEYTRLEAAYGEDLEAKLQSAARMIHELETKQPGLKQLLRSRGVGDSAPVVALLVQQAERYHMRNRQ